MKKVLNFLFLVLLSVNNAVSLASCGSKTVSSKDITAFNEESFTNFESNHILLETIEKNLTANLIDGSTLDQLTNINENPNKDEILRLIKDIVNNKDVKVEISTLSWYTNLLKTNNKVNIKISCNWESRNFDVKFKNIKSKTKRISLEEIERKLTANLIDGSTLDQLIAIHANPNKDEILRLIKVIVNNKNVKVELLTAPEMNLSLTDNKVNIKISSDLEEKKFDVTFKNVKSYSEQEVDDLLDNGFKRIISNSSLLKEQSISDLKAKMIRIINDKRILVNRFFLTEKGNNTCKVFLELKINHQFYNNKIKRSKLSFDYEITSSTSSNNLLEEIKNKLTADLIDGSTLDQLARIGSISNKSKLMRIFETIIGDKKCNIDLEEPEKNLSQTDNTVKIMVSNNFEMIRFIVKFKNVKSYSEQEIDQFLEQAEKKFIKPIDGTEFDDQMLLQGECFTKINQKIATIINDEKININVTRFNKTLHEVKYKVKFEIRINHKIYTNKLKDLSLTLKDVLSSKWHKILRDVEHKLTKHSINAKQLVRDNQLLNQENTINQIKNIIKDAINNNDINVELITKYKTLKDHKNKINIKISNSQGSLSRIFNVTLNNIKIFKIKELDKEKLNQLEAETLYSLLDYKWNIDKKEIKKHYTKCKMLLQDGQLKNFFESWWNKIKKISINERFDFVYHSLQKSVFSILLSEKLKLETIFKNLNTYDHEVLDTNEDVNQFYRYLEKVYQIITDKYAKI